MEKKLAVGAIIKDGLDIGLKNAVPILVNSLLCILTIWIPYINIGHERGLGNRNFSELPVKYVNLE